MVPLNQAKTAQLSADIQLTLPGKHQVGLLNCTEFSPDCTLQTLDVECRDGEENQDGVCKKVDVGCDPQKNEVRTMTGQCTPLSFFARVQSDSLITKLTKPNRYLVGVSTPPSAYITVAPTAKFELDWTYDLSVVDGMRDWIRVGVRQKGTFNEVDWNLPLHFDAKNMPDGQPVNAKLNFTGYGPTQTAEPARGRILISGTVEATP